MQTLFHLIRHGDYPLQGTGFGGRGDHPLSAEGRAQAGRIAARLQGRVAAVISSPVRRAIETAEPLAAACGLRVETDAAFTEIDVAGWSGKRFADLHGDPAWGPWNRFRSTAAVPGGEAMLAVQARAIAGLVRLCVAHPDAALAVVSHADVIKAVLVHFLGAPLDLLRRLEIAPGSTSELVVAPEDAKILAVNLPA